MQRVTLDIGMAFQGAEDALRDIFLPTLFQRVTGHIPKRVITSLLVKQSGISLPDPTRTAGGNWMASCVITGHLVAALHGTDELRLVKHALLLVEGREEICQQHAEEADTTLGEAWAAALNTEARRLGQIQRTGVWLSLLLSTVNGTELEAQEWRDSLFLRYDIEPPDLLSHYDVCGAAFSI